jgi:glycosyltransferase involved in cell wall biosynthesis
MAGEDSVLFIQRRAGRSGAQTCLLRLARADARAGGQPLIVTAATGWLTTAAAAASISVETLPFPSPRSLTARLWGNRLWAGQLAARLKARGVAPTMVVGNDHHESLLALALAGPLKVPSGVILRSSGMTSRDFAKHACGRHDAVFAIGEDFLNRVRSFPGGEQALPLSDGLDEADFVAAPPLSASFPERALVLGTPHPAKGWGDLLAAREQLPEASPLKHIQLDFTATPSAAEREALGLHRVDLTRCRFLERTEDFAARLAEYDLVINASRRETFGMAALEALAAGRVLVSSRTGVVERVIDDPRLLFRADDPADLARALAGLPELWATIAPGIDTSRQHLRGAYGVEAALSQFRAGIASARAAS